MRRLVFFLAILFWSGSPALAESFPFQGWVNADSVNLRAGPGTEQKAVGVAKDQQIFSVLERKGDWYRVRPTRLTIPVKAIGLDGKVKTDSALGPAELGYKVKAGEQLGLFDKIREYDEKVVVYYPKAGPLWIHSKFITADESILGVNEKAWVKVSASPVRAEDFALLAKLREKGGLRYVCLPTFVPEGYSSGSPRTAVRSGGVRDVLQTPSYELKFSKGRSWFTVSAREAIGSAVGEEPFDVQTVLGKFNVSRWVNDDERGPYWTTGVILAGGFIPRTVAGAANTSQSVPQEVGIQFSPDFTREQMTSVLNGLRLVKL